MTISCCNGSWNRHHHDIHARGRTTTRSVRAPPGSPPDVTEPGHENTGENSTEARVVSAEWTIAAGAAEIFEAIADPARQPEWDGNDNLARAVTGQRIRGSATCS